MAARKKYLSFDRKRPASWSFFSSYWYDKEQWYRKYVLGKPDKASKEMEFGKIFAKSCEDRKPLAPVTLLSKMEHEFRVSFNGMLLLGYADAFDEKTKKETGEYKTGKWRASGEPAWTQKRVDEHGQITMYALMNYITNKVKPDDCKFWLEWIPTIEGGDFKIQLAKPVKVFRFETKRTMKQVAEFGVLIHRTYIEMEEYCKNHA